MGEEVTLFMEVDSEKGLSLLTRDDSPLVEQRHVDDCIVFYDRTPRFAGRLFYRGQQPESKLKRILGFQPLSSLSCCATPKEDEKITRQRADLFKETAHYLSEINVSYGLMVNGDIVDKN
jgi:hypothetical protein